MERARVLVVDDDQRNLLAIQHVLEDIAEVVTAESGEQALRHLLNGEFAVILLDVYMPGMNGYEAAEIIRSREQTRRIPIVFLSAVNKEMEHLLRGYAMGAVDYVFKPVDPIVLRSKVAVFVDLFAKTKEIERKALQEQALLDANLKANAELLRAEQELRRAEQRQAAIIQSLPIVLYLEPLDCEPHCPDFVSGDLKKITGFGFDQVRAAPSLWIERIHADDRDRVLAALEARRERGSLSVEYRWQCADGVYRYFHDQAVLLHDSAGQPTEFAGTVTDVSDRRSLESQLIQAQKMDAVGKLTGGIAHDFNNLLAAVIGGLGLIERRSKLGEEELKILAMTQRAAEQGSELVRRLLTFARRQQLEPSSIEIKQLADAVKDLVAHTLGGLVLCDWAIDDDVWPAFADQAQLELALVNLLINARDSMPDGGGIKVSATNQAIGPGNDLGLKSGDYVHIAVSDSGCGIPPDHLEQVLEPFFTTKDFGKGTGLGLSMVYGFVRQSNGALMIDSEVGRGTVAGIWLPRAETISDVARGKKAAPPPAVRPLRILLVDDHPEVRATTAGMLEDLGHRVRSAASGEEAMEALRDGGGDCDLLISDYAMPNLSGTDLVRAARADRPDMPALLITGYADGQEIGARPADVPVLAKPFDLDDLAGAIAALVAPSPHKQSRRASGK